MISATVYALVIVPIVVVALGLLALAWTSASAARIDKARAVLSAQGEIAPSSDGFEESNPFADRRRATAPIEPAGRSGADLKDTSAQGSSNASSRSTDSERNKVDA